MSGKTLLFLGADHFHAYIWKDGELSAPQRFADNPAGREQFGVFLQNHRDPVYLLTDFIEEDFRYETVPHLRGSERAALIQRKFEQYYRNTPFRQALALHRQAEGRRDDEMLFSALTNPALILPWVNTMLAQNIPIVGIYSVPNISAPIVKGISSDHLLLLSWEKHAGLRQTYFDAKHLHFSRLTPINANRTFSETVAEETARTHQYLKSLSLLPPGHVLDVHIICHANDQRDLAEHLQDDVNMSFTYLDSHNLGQRFKMVMNSTDSDATPLFLHLLATQPPRSHYAAAEHTHFFQLYQLRRGLLGLSFALATASLLWTASSIWQGSGLTSDNASLKAQAIKLSQQAQRITQDFPNTLATATDMKTAVLLLRKLGGYSPPPQNILEGLSATLDDFPRIRVDKLSWQTSPATSGASATLPAQDILLSGELDEFSGNYRDALNYLARFQLALTMGGHTVTALTLPLDVSSKGSIAANVGGGVEKSAQFALKITWSPKE